MKGNNPVLVIMDSLGSSIVKEEDMTDEQRTQSRAYYNRSQDLIRSLAEVQPMDDSVFKDVLDALGEGSFVLTTLEKD